MMGTGSLRRSTPAKILAVSMVPGKRFSSVSAGRWLTFSDMYALSVPAPLESLIDKREEQGRMPYFPLLISLAIARATISRGAISSVNR